MQNNVIKDTIKVLFLVLFIFILQYTVNLSITLAYESNVVKSSADGNSEINLMNEKNAKDFIQKTVDIVLSTVNEKLSDNNKITKLNDLFLKSVDIDWMAKFIISKYWRGLTTEQQNKYLDAYKAYIIYSYVPKFREYNGQQEFKMTGAKIEAKQYVIVTTQIIYNGTGKKINIDYRCKIYQNGKIMIIDIIAEGVSLLASQKSEFGSIIARDGGVNALIKIMKDKVDTSK